MSVIAAALRELMALGVEGEALIGAIARIEASLARQSADPAIERRREYDRQRKRKNSGGIPVESAEFRGIPVESAPLSPKVITVPLPEPSALPQTPIPKETPLTGGQRKAVSPPFSTTFAAFWQAYPHKVGKRAAETAFVSAWSRIEATDPLAALLRGIETLTGGRAWREGFRPHPATWLNQDRWLDEPDEGARAPPLTGGIVVAMAKDEGMRMFLDRMEREGEREQGFDRKAHQGPLVALPKFRQVPR